MEKKDFDKYKFSILTTIKTQESNPYWLEITKVHFSARKVKVKTRHFTGEKWIDYKEIIQIQD